jgi:hypothetical protein
MIDNFWRSANSSALVASTRKPSQINNFGSPLNNDNRDACQSRESSPHPITAQKNFFFPFFSITYQISDPESLPPVCYREIEKGVPHRKRPDGKLPAGNHRQFRCYCPPASQKDAGAAGIDSVAEFRGLFDRVSFDGLRFETLRSVPVKGDRAMTIFQFLTITPAPKCVCTP